MEINGPSCAEEYINAFLVPFSRGHRLSREGDRALKLCVLLAFPLPPPGSVVQDVDLPPRLEAVGPEQLSGVVLDLAERYARLPSGLRPNRRVIIEELLPALEELTQIPKCTWSLYPSSSCACGSVQSRAQCRVRDLPEDPPPPYQQVVPTTSQSTGTPSYAQAPGHVYPTPILGAPEEPPPMWLPSAVEQGLVRPTIKPRSQTTVTTTQRAVHRLPPPPGLTPPTTRIPALMSLAPTSGPMSSVTSTSTTRTKDTTASTGPSASSSSQRESWGRGQVRLQGSTQVGSSQPGAQQPSQRRRHAQSQGRSQSQMCLPPEPQRRTQTTTTSEGDRQARAPANPSSSSSAAQQASTQVEAHQETPMDTSELHPQRGTTLAEQWGNPRPFDDEGPDMPKSEGWKADYFTFFRYFLRGHYSHIPLTQLRQIIEPVLRHLGTRREFWARLKEEDPMQLMPYLAAVFKRQTGLALPALANYAKWIKAGSFYHGIIREREELNHTPHLAHAPAPNMNQRSPNEDALISHRQEYKAAFQQAETLLAALAKAQANFTTSLAICREDDREVRMLSLPEPLQARQPQSGAGDATCATLDAPPLSARVPTTSKRQKRPATSEADRPGHSLNPFPLQVDGDRRAMVEILLNTAVGITHTTSKEVARYFQVRYPRMSAADARCGANQLLVSLSEYQLECAIHDLSVVSPVISSQIDQELKPEEEYYDQPPEGTPVDFRLVEQGHTLRFATFLHRINQTMTQGAATSNSVRVEDHGTGPLMQLLLGPGTCPLTVESVIAQVIAENVKTLVELRKRALSKTQQYHIKLVSRMKVVAAMESRISHQENPAEIRRLQKELTSLKKRRNRSKNRRQMHQLIIDRCERDLVYVGELDHPTAPEGVSADAPPLPTTAETAEAPAEASGSTTPMPPLEEDMEVGTIDSPIRTAEDELLNDSDQEESQAQEAEAVSRETSEEAGPDTMPTGGETPSTGVTARLSELSVSSPRAPPTPELEGPTIPTPQESTDDTAPPEAE